MRARGLAAPAVIVPLAIPLCRASLSPDARSQALELVGCHGGDVAGAGHAVSSAAAEGLASLRPGGGRKLAKGQSAAEGPFAALLASAGEALRASRAAPPAEQKTSAKAAAGSTSPASTSVALSGA